MSSADVQKTNGVDVYGDGIAGKGYGLNANVLNNSNTFSFIATDCDIIF